MSKLIPDSIKLVVFDFDDTLVGTREPIWSMHRHIAKKYYDIDLDDETLMKHWGQPIDVLAGLYYRQFDNKVPPIDVLAGLYYQTDDIELGVQRILTENINFPKVKFDHTEAVLKKLRKDGKKIGIVTASHMNLIEIDFVSVGLTKDMVDYIQTADDTNVHKPDPAVFDPMIAWAKKHGISKDEILYVGDGLHDMEAALNAGLNFLGVTTGLVTKLIFKTNGAGSINNLSMFL